MCQRSQIYVVYNDYDNFPHINATYFQWNYGERMISRARYTMEWIQAHLDFLNSFCSVAHKLRYIESVNFDYKDVVVGHDLVEEWRKFGHKDSNNLTDYIFNCDNNDGCLVIDARDKNNLKYCFTEYDIWNSRAMGPVAYMRWDKVPYKTKRLKSTKSNVHWITHHAKLMTTKELKEILNMAFEEGNAFNN